LGRKSCFPEAPCGRRVARLARSIGRESYFHLPDLYLNYFSKDRAGLEKCQLDEMAVSAGRFPGGRSGGAAVPEIQVKQKKQRGGAAFARLG
jgi:hypothetical protein